MVYTQLLEHELEKFPYVVPPVAGQKLTTFSGMQRLIMLDRYSQRDNSLETLKVGDTVTTMVKYDPKYPTYGFGTVTKLDGNGVTIKIEFPEFVEGVDLENFETTKSNVEKPLELYWEQIARRVARGIAKVEKTDILRQYWEEQFFYILANLLYIPGGRINYGAGSGVDVTLFNCFVLPFIKDSRDGIIKHIGLATEIMSRGGGVGSNISTLRPAKAYVAGVNGQSSGSVSWANYLAQLTHLIIQGGQRRGAQMIGESISHPDVIEFILCKIQNHHLLDKLSKESKDPIIREVAEKYIKRNEEGKAIGVVDIDFMTGANISVLVTDDFMDAVENDDDWHLRFPDIENLTPEQKEIYDNEWHKMGDVRLWEERGLPVKIYHTIKAKELWELITICARYSAEPGVIFIDRYEKESNSYYYLDNKGKIVVTNPCGEQGLPGFAVCNLGAINLDRMVTDDGKIDWELFKKVIHISQRFSDNVVDASFYFLPENEEMAKNERRIGKGVMGLADLMIKLGLRYGSEEMLEVTDKIFETLAVESYLASTELAEEKGSFPLFDAEKYLESGYMKKMPKHVREAVRKKGIRNVCSLTVAPTGSTGSMVGVAQGLEPYFAFKMYRSGRLGKFIEINVPIAQQYFDENPDATELPDYFVGAMDLTAQEHIKVQSVIQRWVDSSLSKTANAPKDFTVEETGELYEQAHKLNCKGVTIYVDGSRDTQVLTLEAKDNNDFTEVEEEVVDLMSDTRSCKITFDENGNMIKEC